MEYSVQRGDNVIGTAVVEREGLYYHIRIWCDLDGEIMHRALLRCGGTEENLGVLVPKDGRFGIDTRIPVKKAGQGNMQFLVLPRHGKLEGTFIPLAPEEPFRYISRLKDAYLTRRNGITGIVIKDPGHTEVRPGFVTDPVQDPRDNDRSP